MWARFQLPCSTAQRPTDVLVGAVTLCLAAADAQTAATERLTGAAVLLRILAAVSAGMAVGPLLVVEEPHYVLPALPEVALVIKV
eukprot:6173629-Pleurochrysis_carterae.AAC.2